MRKFLFFLYFGFPSQAKQDLPPRFGGYGASDRVPSVVGVPYVGWEVATRSSLARCKATGCCGCGGAHGFDNQYSAMGALFVGRGPRFGRGVLLPVRAQSQLLGLP